MTSLRVLISGGGIAGSTLGYWLAVGGHRVTIIEPADTQRTSGSPVDVRGRAVPIGQAMGVWPRLVEAATGVQRMAIVDADGRTQAIVRTRRNADPDREVEVSRVDLAATLLDTVADRAEILTGETVVSLVADWSGVDVQYARHGSGRFDIVIGADGLHSGIRRLAFGPEERFSQPLGIFVGTVRTDAVAVDPHEVVLYNMPGAALAVHPAGGKPGAAFMFRSRETFTRHDPQQPTRLIERAYRHGGWHTDRLLDAWRNTEDVYFDAVTRTRVPRWNIGRIALVGDAAGGVSLFGEGSSNAIIGAKTLADEINATPSDPTSAFTRYERVHRKQVSRTGRGVDVMARFLIPATRRGISVRNAMLHTLSSTGVNEEG